MNMTEPEGVPQQRLLTDHIVNPCNDQLRIEVIDAPGPGGANHVYKVSGFKCPLPPITGEQGGHPILVQHPNFVVLHFQNGPIGEVGVNGITHEALLAILIDRFRSFQEGPYACHENANALGYLVLAQQAMRQRTLARMARGVEGTHEK